MSQTYTWKITNLNSKTIGDRNNVVYEAFFNCSKTDSVNGLPFLAVENSKVEFKFDENNFIEYSDLTEEQVLDWIKNTIGNKRVLGLQESVDKQISNAKEKYEKTSGLPW